MKAKTISLFKWLFFLYYDGFKNMKVGKTLWILIAIKLFVMFAIVKWLFFPNILKDNFHTDEERSQYVLEHLMKEK
jgi:hypothetical protein